MSPNSDSTDRLGVFLCHASKDKSAVRDLYKRLHTDGFAPWLDEEDLLLGQEWEPEITQAMSAAYVVVVCLSTQSTISGLVRKEIKFTLDVADKQPEGTIFIVPARLEECDVPERLRRWHWVDLFVENGYELLLRSLHFLAQELDYLLSSQKSIPQATRLAQLELEWVGIPAGEFLMGSADTDQDAHDDEKPQRLICVDEFEIMKYPLTNAQYKIFVDSTGHRVPPGWADGNFAATKGTHPVVYVSWDDAQTCARWLGQETGQPIRLPSEAEWEKAVRGADGRIYPWGDVYDTAQCNTQEAHTGGTTSVGSYPGGASRFGVEDIAGNVWEWCQDWYTENYYPQAPSHNPAGPDRGPGRVVRGGSWYDSLDRARCAFRDWIPPDDRYNDLGVRFSKGSSA